MFLSTGPVPVTWNLQFRTIAIDFWASLEHKIYYKYGGDVPQHLAASLTEAGGVATQRTTPSPPVGTQPPRGTLNRSLQGQGHLA